MNHRSRGPSAAAPLSLHLLAILACASVAGAGCRDPVPDLPPARTSSARATDVHATSLPEGTIDAFGITLPAKSSVKSRTANSLKADVPTEVTQTTAYLKEYLSSFKSETRKKQVYLTEAVPKAAPQNRLEITLRPTALTTEVSFVLMPPQVTAPTEPPPETDVEAPEPKPD